VLQIVKPITLDQKRTIGFFDERSLRVLSIPLNDDSITPEFITTFDLDSHHELEAVENQRRSVP
jgi:hypothetical protein